jgi:inorganic pyrophosphatase
MKYAEWRPHPWHGLDAGRELPFWVNAYIEITPFDLIKYEVGFVPRTYCGAKVAALCPGAARGDGDPLDICVLSERPIQRAEIIVPARVVGGLQLLDRGEADDKLIAVLEADFVWGEVSDIGELPPILVERLQHYFSTYKLVPGTTAQIAVQQVYGASHAARVVAAAAEDYKVLLQS